jgi:hypothetical protein
VKVETVEPMVVVEVLLEVYLLIRALVKVVLDQEILVEELVIVLVEEEVLQMVLQTALVLHIQDHFPQIQVCLLHQEQHLLI